MTKEQPLPLDTRARQAIAELQGTIRERYPTATFEIARAADDPAILHMITTVDVDDPDEVGDLVVDRVVELVAEEHLPIHVIPVRPAARIRAEREIGRRPSRPTRSIRLLSGLPSTDR